MSLLLNETRTDKIVSLGFLCYSLYVDGIVVSPRLNGVVRDISFMLSPSPRGGSITNEAALKNKLTELGCLCYNLYVDNNLINGRVLSLCSSIALINEELRKQACPVTVQPDIMSEQSASSALPQVLPAVSCPPGLEPVPVNPRVCLCGYKNLQRANFCGKCGLKLSDGGVL